MTALLVIDMQEGLFTTESPRHDAEGVIRRINALARAVRGGGGLVIFVQHDEPTGDPFEPGSRGWRLLPSLDRSEGDLVVRKRACDAFYETDLGEVLGRHGIQRLLVTGCATDFCVDTTVRAAASRDYDVVVVEDGHTTADTCSSATAGRSSVTTRCASSGSRRDAPDVREETSLRHLIAGALALLILAGPVLAVAADKVKVTVSAAAVGIPYDKLVTHEYLPR